MSSALGSGYTHVYTGGGKGKTTAALGLALRAVGRGLRVIVIQLLKGPGGSGELRAAEKLAPELRIQPMGRAGVLSPLDLIPADEDLAAQAVDKAREAIADPNWDVVILDEILTACSLGLVKVGDVIGIMDARPEGVELVLTGRGAPKEVIERADLVTEMREVKHYFRKGVAGRPGIER